jgi:hypothetical protein
MEASKIVDEFAKSFEEDLCSQPICLVQLFQTCGL